MITARALDSLAGVHHGFLTRQGGVSDGPYASLNCGFGSGDVPARVTANRQRALDRLDAPAGALVTAYQVHSPRAVAVTAPWQPADAPRADALVSDRPGVALGILTADCAPVLLADAAAGVIGAVHAGWRGARAGVLEAAVEAMTALGARQHRIAVAVGPCIRQESYEVGPEFHAEFLGDGRQNEDFFAPAERGGHFLFDLPAYLARRLAGLALGAVEVVAVDTYGDEERFFSYRRATHRGEKAYGRGLSMIALGG